MKKLIIKRNILISITCIAFFIFAVSMFCLDFGSVPRILCASSFSFILLMGWANKEMFAL